MEATKTVENEGPKFDLDAMTKQWQNLMMDSWGAATKQVVGSDSFAAASSAYMDWALHWQKQMRNNTGQFLDSLEFPKRSDIARLSKQLIAVETRVAEMEDRLDKMVNLLGALSGGMQKLVEHTAAAAAAKPAAADSKAAAEAKASPRKAAGEARPAGQPPKAQQRTSKPRNQVKKKA
jgi:hypothetical protein